MWGNSERWCPEQYLTERHPQVRIFEVELPGRLQGCVSHEEGIIWLSTGLTEVERRCTLAFEVAQLQHGPTPQDPCLAAAQRRDAADWAARMLIPICNLLAGFAASTYLPEIADHLEVDLPTLRTRCRGLTDDEQDAILDAIRGLRAEV